MLDQTLPGVKDLMFSRTQLEGVLRDFCAVGAGVAHVVYHNIGLGDKEVVKTLYHLTDAPAMDEVRHRMAGLRRLEAAIKASPYLEDKDEAGQPKKDALEKERGLWLPALADAEAGDTQINVAISENWSPKKATLEQIAEEMTEADGTPERGLLAKYGQQYAEFALCRRSGNTCRVAIRNPAFTDEAGKVVGRRVFSINDYCIVLGEVPIKFPPTPEERVRHKRSDAWMGVEEPLFRFRGARGRLWEVHPPRGE